MEDWEKNLTIALVIIGIYSLLIVYYFYNLINNKLKFLMEERQNELEDHYKPFERFDRY